MVKMLQEASFEEGMMAVLERLVLSFFST